ncbi:MAG TPA: dienelactone hydrolase family protein [Candidatus Onthocola gallistercoris]|uniref:Dienelactone hydrolase family protein n=1 Tax=Candidatus Onthocola gallistercoris TaxID=2840876 RepID=A0A9D1HHD3_9FIRM|nr:dienelactone hydrolase family protein [Candidatus Onthocola gallistercoris]
MKKHSKQGLCILISVLMMVIGILGAKILQTDFGRVDIRNVSIDSQSGYTLSMDVYVPESATAEDPAATVFVQHGGNNNKEEIQHYCIELARRGYVAIGVDMYGMGESEALPDDQWLTQGRGLYDAVRYGVTLPYVDTERISLLGYSRGGKAAGEALECDNAELNVVKAIFLIHSDPIVRNSEGYADVYGARDVAVLADKNDEFFFSEKANDDGTYSNDANKYAENLSSPAEYVINNSAQSFLYFGEDPANTSEQRVAETVYEKDYGDAIGTRQIFVSNETHMSGWYSPLVMNRVLQFFDRVMPTGTTLSENSYIYTIWNIFKLLALAGLVMFGASLIVWMTNCTKAFKAADRGPQELRPVASGSARAWFWMTQLASILLSILVIWFLNRQGLASYRDALFTSANPTYHGLIALLCGAVNIVLTTIWYVCCGKKQGFDLNASGFGLNWNACLKTIAVVLITVASMLLIVFSVDYLVDVNFLFIYWGFMKFGTNRIPGMILVAPMYILFYVVMSISINSINFTQVLGKHKWLSNLIISFIAAIPTLFILCYVYGIFKATGSNPMFGGLASAATAVYAFPGFVFVAIFVCRMIYQNTGNPYLGGILCGIMAAIAEWNVCEIRVHTPGTAYDGTGLVYTLLVVGFIVIIGCLIFLSRQRQKG